CVGQGMLHQLLALTALRYRNFNLALALGRQRLRQKFSLIEIVRNEDTPWRRLVVIKLRKECTQHFARVEGAVSFREVCPVAPILSGAEEKYFHTGIAAGLMHGE